MLANNILRINGYKNGKRTHIDIEVGMKKIEYTSDGQKFRFEIPDIPHFDDIPWIGFKNGLDGVTSYNYFNYVGNERLTEKC